MNIVNHYADVDKPDAPLCGRAVRVVQPDDIRDDGELDWITCPDCVALAERAGTRVKIIHSAWYSKD